MSTSRRDFLRGLLGATAVAAVPALPLAIREPRKTYWDMGPSFRQGQAPFVFGKGEFVAIGSDYTTLWSARIIDTLEVPPHLLSSYFRPYEMELRSRVTGFTREGRQEVLRGTVTGRFEVGDQVVVEVDRVKTRYMVADVSDAEMEIVRDGAAVHCDPQLLLGLKDLEISLVAKTTKEAGFDMERT